MNCKACFGLSVGSRVQIGGVVAAFLFGIGAIPNVALASYHLLQIEQVIGGVNGDTSAQAIQLRMRFDGQNELAPARMRVFDAQGNNPIVLVDFNASVANGAAGSRVLIAGPGFASHTTPAAVPDFVMINSIPRSYFNAGSLTFETDDGFDVYWRLSWGDYTGPSDGVSVANGGNDDDGNFNPSFFQLLSADCTIAHQFIGAADAESVGNGFDYTTTTGPATFVNNAGNSFVINGCTSNANCNDGISCTSNTCHSGCCQFTPNDALCSDGEFCTGAETCSLTTGGCVSPGDPCGPLTFCDEDADACLNDCNQNGIDDLVDVGPGGGSNDCDDNNVPDECDPDCDFDDVPDICEECGTGTGDCCSAHAGTKCGDPCCCAKVCADIPSCCTDEWDAACAKYAEQICIMCGPPCEVPCPGGSSQENEPDCGMPTDTVNGGCNSIPPAFTQISCGETVCGTVGMSGFMRDMDWYMVTVPDDTQVYWEVTADFFVEFGVAPVSDCFPLATNYEVFCNSSTVTACLTPGTWAVYVAPQFAEDVTCGEEYVATLLCDSATCAQPPTNDTCETAELLTVGQTLIGSTSLASADIPPFCEVALGAQDVWYKIVGNGNYLAVSLCNPETNFDTTLSLYCGECVDPFCVDGDDDFCGNPPGHSRISWCSNPGTEYLIRVSGFESAGTFEMTVSDELSCSLPATCGGFSCTQNSDCLSDAGNNGCNCAMCISGFCNYTCSTFGNTNCELPQVVNLDDILCTLGGFSNINNCPNADIAPCGGNGIINLDDILAVLAAFSGGNPCGCTENTDPGNGLPPLCGSTQP